MKTISIDACHDLLLECHAAAALLDDIAEQLEPGGEWRAGEDCVEAGDFCCTWCEDHGCLSMKRESLKAALLKAEGGS